VHARHLAGVLNVRADRASRYRDDRTEWRLSEEAFEQVEQAFGPHTCDLFASRRNALCQRFFSRWLDPSAADFDAFAQDWTLEENAYAHPPYAIMGRVLAHVREQRATITLVAPLWAAHSWFSDLMELSIEVPRVIVCDNLVAPVLPTRFPPRQPRWLTAVWRISGDDSKNRASTVALRTALWPDGTSPP
jgi:hypothetical protein